MKSTKAMKNIRLFKNAANGRPKRVTTGVDDYGNRFHVVGGKVKQGNTLHEKKKTLREQRKRNSLFLMNHRKTTPKDVNTYTAIKNRENVINTTTGKTRKLHTVKSELAKNRFYTNTKRSTKKLQQISKRIRRLK